VNPNVRVMVVPGSQEIKRQAEAEGLDRIFTEAGRGVARGRLFDVHRHERRSVQPGEYSVSTSNRNFEGRQGKGGRTFLASPLTAAASAVTGVVTDVRHCSVRRGEVTMEKFTAFESKMVLLPVDNIDTDQIIPARFLKTISKAGLGDQLFYDWRYKPTARRNRISS
jgi:aconitase A